MSAAGVASLVLGGIGMTYGLVMDAQRRKKAQRALDRMGKRPQLTTPKEVLAAYQNRLNRSKQYQGFTDAERNRSRQDIASTNAGLAKQMQGMGGSAQAIQAGFANQNARANVQMAAESARMNRAGQAQDLNAADAYATDIGKYQTANEQDAGQKYDQQVANYGNVISESYKSTRDTISGLSGLALQGGMGGVGLGAGIGQG
jgi:hypothetical protein